MIERLPHFRNFAIMTALGIGAIGISGCGEADESTQPTDTAPTANARGGYEVEIRQTFNDRGQMITKYEGSSYRFDEHVLTYCSGNDMVDIMGTSGYAGGGVSRTLNHPACDDGRLTPEDFAANTTTPTTLR